MGFTVDDLNRDTSDQEVEAIREKRRAIWQQVYAAFGSGDVALAKKLMADLQEEATERYRAMYGENE